MAESFETIISVKMDMPKTKSDLWCFEWWSRRRVCIEAVKCFPGYLNIMIYHTLAARRLQPMATIKILMSHIKLSVLRYQKEAENLISRGHRNLYCYQIEWVDDDVPCKMIFGFDLEQNRDSHMSLIRMYIAELTAYQNDVLDSDGSSFNRTSRKKLRMLQSPGKENQRLGLVQSSLARKEIAKTDIKNALVPQQANPFKEFMMRLF